jgi:N-acetylmuramoyl-L-alanine amidase
MTNLTRPLLAPLVLFAFSGAVQAATIKNVAIEPADPAAGGDARLVVTLDDRFDAPSAFVMDEPRRLVVDLPGNKADTRSYEGQGPVSRTRTAQFSATSARLVVDLAAPVTIGDAVAADNKLIVTLRAADAAAFRRQVAKGRAKLPGIAAAAEVAQAAPSAGPSRVAVPAKPTPGKAAAEIAGTAPAAKPVGATAEIRAATPSVMPAVATDVAGAEVQRIPVSRSGLQAAATLPTVSKATTNGQRTVALRPAYRPLVVIDAGHGGKDVGALSVVDAQREKDVTLAIARAIQRELEASGRVRVMLTRSDDRFLPLPQRVAIAQAAKAHLFISVHADSAPVPEARGATVYTLSEVASDKEAARLAAKENKSDVLAGINVAAENADVADILIDLAQRETMNVSSEFAATLQREMAPKVYFKSNAHRFAGFRVLKAPDVPSVLLETGYLSNETDSRFLFSEAGRKAIAEGVRKAVEAHFLRRVAQR